jgi:hypothetical protein
MICQLFFYEPRIDSLLRQPSGNRQRAANHNIRISNSNFGNFQDKNGCFQVGDRFKTCPKLGGWIWIPPLH